MKPDNKNHGRRIIIIRIFAKRSRPSRYEPQLVVWVVTPYPRCSELRGSIPTDTHRRGEREAASQQLFACIEAALKLALASDSIGSYRGDQPPASIILSD